MCSRIWNSRIPTRPFLVPGGVWPASAGFSSDTTTRTSDRRWNYSVPSVELLDGLSGGRRIPGRRPRELYRRAVTDQLGQDRCPNHRRRRHLRHRRAVVGVAGECLHVLCSRTLIGIAMGRLRDRHPDIARSSRPAKGGPDGIIQQVDDHRGIWCPIWWPCRSWCIWPNNAATWNEAIRGFGRFRRTGRGAAAKMPESPRWRPAA